MLWSPCAACAAASSAAWACRTASGVDRSARRVDRWNPPQTWIVQVFHPNAPGPSYGGVGPESSGGVWGRTNPGFEEPRALWSVWAYGVEDYLRVSIFGFQTPSSGSWDKNGHGGTRNHRCTRANRLVTEELVSSSTISTRRERENRTSKGEVVATGP